MKRIHKKFTQKQLKELVSIGKAIDITGKYNAINEDYAQIGYSNGANGVNGVLYQGISGNLYVCLNSTAMLTYRQ